MELNREEALRYAGVTAEAPVELRQRVGQLAERTMRACSPRFIWRVYPLQAAEDGSFSAEGTDLVLRGNSARTMLRDCSHVVLLACTIGSGFDALLLAEQARNMADAVLLDACGSAWVEAGCDAAEEEIRARLPGKFLTDRFSPGYGDLPLDLQPGICRLLNTEKYPGITVGESLLMNPVKSVTALIGLADRPQMARIRGCGYCAMKETCALRRGGSHCHA